jgi:hypothetical protein
MNQNLIDQAVREGAVMTYDGINHALYSVNPPETLFNYTYFSHCIPPFKPENVLILGYGCGTVAKLIYKIWGTDIKVTGIDIEKYDDGLLEPPRFLVKIDALKYIQECGLGMFKKRFDYVVMDVWNGYEVPQWIFSKSTAKILSVNIPRQQAELMDMYTRHGFNYDRSDIVDKNFIGFFSKVKTDE